MKCWAFLPGPSGDRCGLQGPRRSDAEGGPRGAAARLYVLHPSKRWQERKVSIDIWLLSDFGERFQVRYSIVRFVAVDRHSNLRIRKPMATLRTSQGAGGHAVHVEQATAGTTPALPPGREGRSRREPTLPIPAPPGRRSRVSSGTCVHAFLRL